MNNKLLIVGAGGHGRSVAEAVMAADRFQLVGFVDDAQPDLESVWGKPVFGTTADLHRYRAFAQFAIVAIGNNTLREALTNKLKEAGFELATIIHPCAIVSPRAVIGAGSTIMAGAIIGTEAILGRGVLVNCGAVVDHHAHVDDFGHLSVHACMAGEARLGHGAWLQAGVALGYGVNVGPRTVLACAVAVKK